MTNPLIRKASKPAGEVTDRYECLGLADNPFPNDPTVSPDSPDPRRNGNIYCSKLHEDKREQFENLLVPGAAGAPVKNIAFLMDHASSRGRGIGKTAFLNRRQRDISEDLGARASEGSSVLFAVHVIPAAEPARRKFWDLAKLIAERLIDKRIIGQAVCRIRAMYPEMPDEVICGAGKIQDWEDTIGDDKWLGEHKVDVLWGLNQYTKDAMVDAGVDEELAEMLSYRGCKSRDFYVKFFESYKDAWWRSTGGRVVFDDFVKLFRLAGFTRGLLLVDEVEKIVYRQNIQERRNFSEALRYYLSDGDCLAARSGFYGVVLTIHPGIQELLLPHWRNAGLDRVAPLHQPDIQQCEISFGPLDPSQAEMLVLEYLNAYRIKGADGGLKPFLQGAIEEALHTAKLVPGPMLKLLHNAIEEAARLGRSNVDGELIREFYRKQRTAMHHVLREEERLPDPDINLSGMKSDQ